jgi:subtilase family serine protease
MNARHLVRTVALVLVLSPALIHAQVLTRGSLPDLQPLRLGLETDCRMIVTIANNGPGQVPDAGYTASGPGSSEVYMTVDGVPWAFTTVGNADPSKLTQPAGGTVSFPWFASLDLPPGTHTVRVDVDGNNAIAENNETNNTLTTTMTCNQALSDLQPFDLTLDANCRIDVAFRNNGPGDVPDSGYSPVVGAGLYMYIDGTFASGIVLSAVDPTRLSQPVGGTKIYKWLSLSAGSHTVKVTIDPGNKVAEANEWNNTFQKVLSCQQPLPDLVPTDITLHPTGPFINSPCSVKITLQNIGSAAVPDSGYALVGTTPTLQMWKNGAGFGGGSLGGWDPSKGTQPAGATFTSRWMSPTSNITVQPGEYTLRIDVDANNALAELSDANNSLTKTVRCGTQILPPIQ